MNANPLKSLDNYSVLIAELLNRASDQSSTVTIWSVSPFTGVAEGEVKKLKH